MPTCIKPHHAPSLAVTLFIATVIITYTISITLKHTEADFPYISDTGTEPPESCIFGQLFDIIAVLLAATIYIRYKQIDEFYNSHAFNGPVVRYNKVGIVFGMVATFGLSLVANFQETNVVTVHYTGAFFCFGFGTLYMMTQAILSYKMHPVLNGMPVAHFRMLLSILCGFLFVNTAVCAIMARSQFHGDDPHKWYPGDGGWKLHVASTVSEWCMAGLFQIFLLTYISEFKKISFHAIRVRLPSVADGAENAGLVPEVPDGPEAVEVPDGNNVGVHRDWGVEVPDCAAMQRHRRLEHGPGGESLPA